MFSFRFAFRIFSNLLVETAQICDLRFGVGFLKYEWMLHIQSHIMRRIRNAILLSSL